jgi:hypothetical protein
VSRTPPPSDSDTLAVEPDGDLGRIEAEQMTPLDERNATFSDEPADVPLRDTQVLSDAIDVEQSR